QAVNLLQLWVFPHTQNVSPRYDQKNIAALKKPNTFYPIVTPDPSGPALWIHQDAWFHLGEFDQETTLTYTLHKPGNGVYTFVIEGGGQIAEETLGKRDALGIWETDSFSITAKEGARLLLLEVPMHY
ncbi:MAG: pirin family protein, partial [Flavobacteriaceae bacterium]